MTSEVVRGRDLKSELQGRLRLLEAAVFDPTCKGVASVTSGGGVPASEASLPPEASQVVAEGDGLRVHDIMKTEENKLTDIHFR